MSDTLLLQSQSVFYLLASSLVGLCHLWLHRPHAFMYSLEEAEALCGSYVCVVAGRAIHRRADHLGHRVRGQWQRPSLLASLTASTPGTCMAEPDTGQHACLAALQVTKNAVVKSRYGSTPLSPPSSLTHSPTPCLPVHSEHGVKVSMRSPLMMPTVALIDPLLTVSVPPHVTAHTGLDALCQNIEVRLLSPPCRTPKHETLPYSCPYLPGMRRADAALHTSPMPHSRSCRTRPTLSSTPWPGKASPGPSARLHPSTLLTRHAPVVSEDTQSSVSNSDVPTTLSPCAPPAATNRAARSLRTAYRRGGDILAREDMALASVMGGLALANAKLGRG